MILHGDLKCENDLFICYRSEYFFWVTLTIGESLNKFAMQSTACPQYKEELVHSVVSSSDGNEKLMQKIRVLGFSCFCTKPCRIPHVGVLVGGGGGCPSYTF